MQVLIIPDVHLKFKMFDRADAILKSGQAEKAVVLGDLVDDWHCEMRDDMYKTLFERARKFHKEHPNTLWCWGNHDLAYFHCHPCSGTSIMHMGTIRAYQRRWIKAVGGQGHGLALAIVHKIDNVLFSHAGISADWVERNLSKKQQETLENVLKGINEADLLALWEKDSPVWYRPQIDGENMWGPFYHVVGHTPLYKVEDGFNVVSTDVFSSDRDGEVTGERRFIIVDTESGNWRYADERDLDR